MANQCNASIASTTTTARRSHIHPYFLFQELPSEKDSPETLRAKMGSSGKGVANVPVPATASKFGKKDESYGEANPFGFDEEDEDRYW